MNDFFIVGCIPLIIATLLFAQFTLRYIYDYKLGKSSIDIKFFRVLTFYKIPFNRIDTIRVATFKDLWLPNFYIRFGNRAFGSGVLIKQKGFHPGLIITPDDPIAFINTVNGSINMSHDP